MVTVLAKEFDAGVAQAGGGTIWLDDIIDYVDDGCKCTSPLFHDEDSTHCSKEDDSTYTGHKSDTGHESSTKPCQTEDIDFDDDSTINSRCTGSEATLESISTIETVNSLLSTDVTINDEESFNSHLNTDVTSKGMNILSRKTSLGSQTDTLADQADAKTRSGKAIRTGRIHSLKHYLKRGQGATSTAKIPRKFVWRNYFTS
jgi:hypothetical protein